MTHTELCDWLRHLPAYLSENGIRAADAIERLAAENDTLIGQLAATTTLYNNLYNRMTVMSGNVRLVEELEDGAIFEVGPGVRND